MLPASTCSPPKRFTPRRLECESRPLRVLPPAFLCAIAKTSRRLAGTNARDLHFGEHLPVALLAQIVLAAPKLDDRHLGALAVTKHRGAHFAALQMRNTDLHIRAFAHQEDLAKLHGRARLRIEFLDANDTVLGDPILFT